MILKFNKFVKSSFELLIDEKSIVTENSKFELSHLLQ